MAKKIIKETPTEKEESDVPMEDSVTIADLATVTVAAPIDKTFRNNERRSTDAVSTRVLSMRTTRDRAPIGITVRTY